jgi:hypothetical protein
VAEFIPFDTFEQAQEYMRRAEEAANANLQEGQIALRDDVDNERYWMQFTQYGFIVYGHCWSKAKLTESTKATYAKYPDEDDFSDDEIESSLEARKRGYMFGEAWSSPYPEGELGSTHVSQVVPISEAMFNAAREARWNLQ